MSWEYHQETCKASDIGTDAISARLATLGEADWELVSVVLQERHGYSHEAYMFFKKPKAPRGP